MMMQRELTQRELEILDEYRNAIQTGWVDKILRPWMDKAVVKLQMIKITSSGPSTSGQSTTVRVRVDGHMRSYTCHRPPGIRDVLDCFLKIEDVNKNFQQFRSTVIGMTKNPPLIPNLDQDQLLYNLFNRALNNVKNSIDPGAVAFNLDEAVVNITPGMKELLDMTIANIIVIFLNAQKLDHSVNQKKWDRSIAKQRLRDALRKAIIKSGLDDDEVLDILKKVQVESVMEM